MAVRDPETGQFVSGGGSPVTYEDIEPVHYHADFSVEASELGGGTGQNYGNNGGYRFTAFDMDEVVDRNEMGVLLRHSGKLTVTAPSTQTADGTVRAEATVTTAENPPQVHTTGGYIAVDDQLGFGGLTVDVAEESGASDTIDPLGRKMVATTGGQFSDGATGVGGAAGEGDDSIEMMWPFMWAPRISDREEVNIAGVLEASNVSDASIHAEISGVLEFARVDR